MLKKFIIFIIIVLLIVFIPRHIAHDQLREALLKKSYNLSSQLSLHEPFLDEECANHTGYNISWAQSSSVWCWKLIISKPKYIVRKPKFIARKPKLNNKTTIHHGVIKK